VSNGAPASARAYLVVDTALTALQARPEGKPARIDIVGQHYVGLTRAVEFPWVGFYLTRLDNLKLIRDRHTVLGARTREQ
jgi:hypothetical protein